MAGRIVVLGLIGLGVMAAAEAAWSQEPGQIRIIAIHPTPEQVQQRHEEREREIAAEPQVEGLPRGLSYFLRTRHPELSVIPWYEADNYRLGLAQDIYGQASPFACLGDFDGNGLEDVAVMVRDFGKNEARLAAFHQVERVRNPGGLKSTSYRLLDVAPPFEVPPDYSFAETIIVCQPPGDYEDIEGTLTLGLNHHSIATRFTIHFYLGGKYISLMIGD